MKIIFIVATILIFIGIENAFADSYEEEVFSMNIRMHTYLDSYLRLNDEGQPFALIVKKRDTVGRNGCRFHRGTMSSPRCHVRTKEIDFPNLSVNSDNVIIYNNGLVRIDCGIVKSTWLGRRIRLNKKCNLISRKKTLPNGERFNLIVFTAKE